MAFCKKDEIKREMIVPYNPQQNGVAEHKNKSMEESIKAMMHDQDFPMSLWGEASLKTIYI